MSMYKEKLFDDGGFNPGGLKKIFTYLAGGLAGLSVIMGSAYSVDETQRGLEYQMGKLVTTNQNDIVKPGLNFKIPFVQSVKKFPVSFQQMNLQDVQTYTKDNQVITANLSYLYRAPESSLIRLARENPDWEAKMQTAVIDSVKGALGQYDATAVALNRNAIMAAVTKQVSNKVRGLYGIEVRDVQMTNFDFSDAFEKGVERASQAKNDQIRKRTELENARIDAQKKVVDATATADASRLSTDAEAYKSRTIKEAEADGFKVISAAIGQQNMKDYLYTQKWKGNVPAVQGGNSITDLRGITALTP
ncbi:MAG: hypothetical protein DI551_02615 [Micavibrio aeruginosavorus]|uniref:Band 7 domain-containing protein n=1 Tax=Micavibrio aeruginosavorus TaxID=349221 RepID=A0A2W5N448_9BACT|nr:MAG: hypothetical protein DI551_02615 [Micavibrio aeruginosavorus]